MKIVRNIYCNGTFEGSYRLDRLLGGEGYIWIIIAKADYLPLYIEPKRDNNHYKNDKFYYGRIIPFKESDLCE